MQLINISMDKYIHSSEIALEFRIEYLILKQKMSFMKRTLNIINNI